jgi:predicted transglutaminase-like cysteine proteinase
MMALLMLMSAAFSVVWAIEFSQAYLDEISKKYGDYARRRLVGWEKLTKDYKNADELKKIEAVNTFFNLIEYVSNIDHWGKADYWATPLEFLVSGGGDCEDFTVAKYFTLLDLGVPDDKLLITYVKALETNQAHMVLSYYPSPDSIPLILDNLNKELLSADKRTDLKPIYSFNGTGLWAAKQMGLGNKIGKPTDIERWVTLQEKIKAGKIGKFNPMS